MSGSDEDIALINKYMSGKTVSGIVGDTENNKYISYLNKEKLPNGDYRIVPKVMKVYIKNLLKIKPKLKY